MADALFATAGLIDDDDIAMNSPHLQNGFHHHGIEGPGAIGQPTSVYNQSRKPDDLGLNTLLSQARSDRAVNQSGYELADSTAARWDDWARLTRGVEATNSGYLDAKYGAGAPLTAPLFGNSSVSPQLSLQALNIGTSNTPTHSADAASQALGHLSSLQSLIAPMARATDEVEKLQKEVEMWKNDWHKVGEEKRGMERAINEFRAEMEREKVVGEAKQVRRPTITQRLHQTADSQIASAFSVVLIDGDGLIVSIPHRHHQLAMGPMTLGADPDVVVPR